MYENEYSSVYTDRHTDGSANSQPNNSNKNHDKKGGLIAGCLALILVGILLGCGISYAYMNSRVVAPTQNADEKTPSDSLTKPESNTGLVASAEKSEAADEKNEIELHKAEESSEPMISEIETTGKNQLMTVQDIAADCLNSVVAITNTGVKEVRSMWGAYTTESKSAGSGVIIGETEEELLILTNYHVVQNNAELSVVFSWEEGSEDVGDTDIIEAKVKAYDEGRDIAVIAIKMDSLSKDTREQIVVATIGDSNKLQLGEQIVAIGNALGYGQSVTTGIVSALDRSGRGNSGYGQVSEADKKYTFIQTDAAINPGNSGGAMFNMKGELVGINSAKIGGSSVEGMGYAIPISDIIDDVEDMMNSEIRDRIDAEKRGYLGVSIVDVTEAISNTYGMPRGIYISSVNPGSAAEKAGMEKEDIITALNGKELLTGAELKDELSYYALGDVVTVTIARRGADGYESKDMMVILAENPDIAIQ